MTLPSFADAIATVIAALPADVRPTADLARLNPPAAWVTGVAAREINLAAGWEIDLDIYAVVGSVDDPRAFSRLDALAQQVLAVVPLDETRDLEVSALTAPGSSTPLPAYRIPTRVIQN